MCQGEATINQLQASKMFNIGSGEIALIAVVALLILGPTRLPELARGIGKFMREFRRQTDEVRGVVEREFYRMDTELQKDPTETLQVRPANDGLAVPKNPYPTPSEEEAALAAPPEHVASQLTAGMPPDTVEAPAAPAEPSTESPPPAAPPTKS